jgi:hypothetical protein
MLTRSLREYLAEAAATHAVAVDWRDVLVALAPYHDCAHRLGVDPGVLFDDVSEDVPSDLQAIVRQFARRSDVTLDAFGWTLATSSDGPCYEPAWKPGDIGGAV